MALERPPKEYYRLKEIVDEWEWTEIELFNYAEQGKLEISIWFKHVRATVCAIEYLEEQVFAKEELINVFLDGAYPILPSQMDELGHSYIEFLNQDAEALKLNPRIGPYITSFEEKKPYFGDIKYGYEFREFQHNPCLVITHKEKTRFEQGSAPNETTIEISNADTHTQKILGSGDDIGIKERGTWLKIIHLLAAKLADTNKSAYLKKDGSFNFSKFEEVLKIKAGDLLGNDDSTGNIGYGLSNDNLKKIFDEAKKLF